MRLAASHIAVPLVFALFAACGGQQARSEDPVQVDVSYAPDSATSNADAAPLETLADPAPNGAAVSQPVPAAETPAVAEIGSEEAQPKSTPNPETPEREPPPKVVTKDPRGTVRVKLTGFRNNTGKALLAVFTSKDGFPERHSKAFAKTAATIRGGLSVAVFKKVPPGEFAIVVLHDENGDKKMEKNFIGVPKEGFGMSRNPKVGMSAPSFKECALRLAPSKDVQVIIKMKYM